MAATRPSWQWVLIGSGLFVTIWTPSVGITLAIARKIAAARAGGPPLGPGLAAALVALTFALSAVAAGYLVARFGPRTRLAHTVFAGLVASAEIWLLALLGGAFTSVLVACTALVSLSLIGGVFCGLGGWLRRRRKSAS
ncbi:MAG TPA: hypothetical protein VEQ59_12495 [Polyangiaceae bacterium]|nr:hypothetical protein [Polyangiaceae bacterium]